MRILLLRAGPENDWQPLQYLAAAQRAHQPAAVGIVCDSTRSDVPVGTLVLPDAVPRGRAARAVRACGPRSPAPPREAESLWYASELRDVELFVLPLALPPRILLLGAGPDVVPVVDLAVRLNWKVTLVDHRAAYASRTHFPCAAAAAAGASAGARRGARPRRLRRRRHHEPSPALGSCVPALPCADPHPLRRTARSCRTPRQAPRRPRRARPRGCAAGCMPRSACPSGAARPRRSRWRSSRSCRPSCTPAQPRSRRRGRRARRGPLGAGRVNEIQLIRAQLEVERERAQAIAAACTARARAGRAGGPEQRLAAGAVPAGVRGLPGVRARLVRGARPAARGLLDRYDPHDPTRDALDAALTRPGRSRDALEKLEAAFATPRGRRRDPRGRNSRTTSAGPGARAAKPSRRCWRPAGARPSGAPSSGIDADAMLEERSRFARVNATLPPGLKLPACAARPGPRTHEHRRAAPQRRIAVRRSCWRPANRAASARRSSWSASPVGRCCTPPSRAPPR